MRHNFEVAQVSFIFLQSHLADLSFVSSPSTPSGASGNLPWFTGLLAMTGKWAQEVEGGMGGPVDLPS